jgi:hypothetical protein
MEHTQVLHSSREPARISARNAIIAGQLRAVLKSTSICASAGPEMKKQGCTRPVAPITAENSGALQRTGG